MNASGLSSDQIKLQARVRELASGPVARRAAEVDRTEQYPWDNVELLKSEKLLGMTIPTQYGGQSKTWLDAVRANRDTPLVRRLLRWKYAAKTWGIDAKAWNAALIADYKSAQTAAARAIVTDEYDDWFQLDEDAVDAEPVDRIDGLVMMGLYCAAGLRGAADIIAAAQGHDAPRPRGPMETM